MSDPIILQVLLKLADACSNQINQDNGFFTNLSRASVEPISISDEGEPELSTITFFEESSTITDSRLKNDGVRQIRIVSRNTVIVAQGLLYAQAPDAWTSAYRFRDDIERMLGSVTEKTLCDDNGRALLSTMELRGLSEIANSDVAQGYIEINVRLAVTYRDTKPPVPGI